MLRFILQPHVIVTLASLSLTLLSDFQVLSYIRDLRVFTNSIYQHGSLQWT